MSGLKRISIIPLVEKLPRYLDDQPSKVYSKPALAGKIRDFSKAIHQPLDTAPETYIDCMVEQKILHQLVLTRITKGETELYTFQPPNPLEIGKALKEKGYFSHLTAAFIHGFIEKEISTIYISSDAHNNEAQHADLDQEITDTTLAKPQRQATSGYQWKDYTFLFLNARVSGLREIETRKNWKVTIPECTLIDLLVRPQYGGAATTIAGIYKKVVQNVDISLLIKREEEIKMLISELREMIKQVQPKIDNISGRRNTFYAHGDPHKKLPPEKLSEINEINKTAQTIFNKLTATFKGSNFIFDNMIWTIDPIFM